VTRLTLDTNVLFYAFDARDPAKQKQAIDIIAAAAQVDCPLALQAIGEFYVATTRKAKLSAMVARREVENLVSAFDSFATTETTHLVAAQEASSGRLFYWDAVLLASAAEAGCTLCLSEDMQDGLRLGHITVHNPFGKQTIADAARRALGL
jgi:predicted nucleic acid-binding protein